MKPPFIAFLAIPLLLLGSSANAQIKTTDINTINTAVPFLRIAPDARSGAMGDVGIAVSEDADATYWNPAKLAFAKKDMAIGVTYTPWLKQLVNDIYLAHLSAYKKVDKNSAIGASLRYFSLGNIQFTNYQGDPIGDFRPRELAFDLDYSRLLSKHLSVALALRYIYSNLAAGQSVNGVQVNAANGVATDVSAYYKKDIKMSNSKKGLFSLGLSMTNLGTKMTYTKTATNKDYLPANLGLGSAFKMDIDKYNSLEFGLDINKLLVPTPDLNDQTLAYQNKSPLSGALGSFNDAPGGMKEEFKEINYSAGIEYWYINQFAVRAGYFFEDPSKGNRKYLTVGVGVKYSVLCLNFSYLVPTSGVQKSPLDNTLRFSLLFDLQNAEKGNTTPATI